jgi:hypothetical protein
MKGRDGKTNIDLNEPPGAFVGAEAGMSVGGEPPRKSRGPQRVKGDNFMASGESQATSIKAVRIPTHWRRGGFVQKRANGGEVDDLVYRGDAGNAVAQNLPASSRNTAGATTRTLPYKSKPNIPQSTIDKFGVPARERARQRALDELFKPQPGDKPPGDADKGPPSDPNRDPETNYARGGHLNAAARKALPSTSFALPGQGKGPQGKGSGSYPIPDASHARNALARVSQHGNPSQQSKVRAAVHRKFPGIGKK